MSSIQFRSIADTVAAFERLDCSVWSLWDGKRFMFKGIGADELKAFLDLMDNNGSTNAEYILAYYDKLSDPVDVNNKTAFDGSFKFRLNSSGTEITTGQYRQIGSLNEMQSRMSAIENKLDAVLLDDSDDKEQGSSLGVIGEILGHPSIAPIMPLIIEKIVSSFFNPVQQPVVPQQISPAPLRKVSGIDAASITQADTILKNAIERLLRADKDLPMHLSKLADLSERDPNSFNYIVKMLESLQTV